VSWPFGPGGFLAFAGSLGSRFTLGVGLFTPYTQRVRWETPAAASPTTRYHAIDVDLRNVALTPALSIRVAPGVRIGAAPGFLFSVGRLTFDEDTGLARAGVTCDGAPCGAENPAAAARYEIVSSLDPFDATLAFTVGGGLYVDRRDWSLGVAYTSRPLATDDGVAITARRTRIGLPANQPAEPALCGPSGPSTCVYGHLQYDLPDVITAGFTYRLSPRLDLTLVLRWLNLSRHDALRIRLASPAADGLEARALPESIVLHRGFRDVWDARLQGAIVLGNNLRLGASVRTETGAVGASRVTPAAVDGWKLEPAAVAQLSLTGRVLITAGYAFTFMPDVNASASVFDPQANLACETVGGDLDSPACQARRRGQARPTAAGKYHLLTHTLSLSVATRL
jgi:long-subunit fatty acid transport protein